VVGVSTFSGLLQVVWVQLQLRAVPLQPPVEAEVEAAVGAESRRPGTRTQLHSAPVGYDRYTNETWEI